MCVMTSLSLAVVQSLRTNSKPDFSVLNEKYLPLFKSLARQFSIDVEDVISTAYIIWAEDETFDEQKGDYEPRFIFLVRNKVLNDNFQRNYELSDEIANTVAAPDEMTEVEDWRADEELKTKNLGGDIGKLVHCLLDGMTFEEVAQTMGITLRRVEQIAQKAMSINEEQADLFR